MAVLRPYPFGALVRRALRELDERQALFDLPVSRGFLGEPDMDLGVWLHGRRVSSPYGPAAGPHTQLAQNIALAWLGGARVIELKTVQVDDRLEIPRPCIDMQTIGFNVEWSQELTLPESLLEYVKASMLIEILVASGRLRLATGFDQTRFDMSVGYDLAGIRSDAVQAFIRGLGDATTLVDRLRHEIPSEYSAFRDLPFTTCISDSLTLSTFHGCPPDEIEGMLDHLMSAHGLHCVVKLNPTLLGAGETRRILYDVLGYDEVRVPDEAFEHDTTWNQMTAFVDRLDARARHLGRGFGVKFTNTLVVENNRDVFPSTERRMYLSGPPLHVLAMRLVGRFRDAFGDRVPVSFSAGIDRHNFAEAVSLGLVPVTVCSDLLKPRGYARSRGYFTTLVEAMRARGARTIDEYVVGCASPGGDRTAVVSPASVRDARLASTRTYVEALERNPRYTRAATSAVPRKIGRSLVLFDCLTCDKCVPVCPNDANFTFVLPPASIPIERVRWHGERWVVLRSGAIEISEAHQIGNVADLCNDCGNCDVFCPEDGGPYNLKPRVFWSLDAYHADRRDGICAAGTRDACVLHGRFRQQEFVLATEDDLVQFSGPGFDVAYRRDACLDTLSGTAEGEIDLTVAHILDVLRAALLDPGAVTYLTCLTGSPAGTTRAGVDPSADRRS